MSDTKTIHTDHGRYVGIPNGNGTVTLQRRGPAGAAPASRPDPIAALAEAWGRDVDAWLSPRMSEAQYIAMESRDTARRHAAIAKRASRAAKRAENERRTAEGRAPLWVRLRPRRAFWDWCEWRIRNGEWHVRNGSALGEPRWRIRSRERRALPGMERPWMLSPAQVPPNGGVWRRGWGTARRFYSDKTLARFAEWDARGAL